MMMMMMMNEFRLQWHVTVIKESLSIQCTVDGPIVRSAVRSRKELRKTGSDGNARTDSGRLFQTCCSCREGTILATMLLASMIMVNTIEYLLLF